MAAIFMSQRSFLQQDQNKVIQDGDETAEMQVWRSHGRQMPLISIGLTL
jgi:hypothetical protein